VSVEETGVRSLGKKLARHKRRSARPGSRPRFSPPARRQHPTVGCVKVNDFLDRIAHRHAEECWRTRSLICAKNTSALAGALENLILAAPANGYAAPRRSNRREALRREFPPIPKPRLLARVDLAPENARKVELYGRYSARRHTNRVWVLTTPHKPIRATFSGGAWPSAGAV